MCRLLQRLDHGKTSWEDGNPKDVGLSKEQCCDAKHHGVDDRREFHKLPFFLLGLQSKKVAQ